MKSARFLYGATLAGSLLALGFGLAAQKVNGEEPIVLAAISTAAEPPVSGESSGGGPMGAAPAGPRAWLQQIFLAAAGDSRQQALAQIEAVGLSPDANSAIRAVTAKNRRLIDLFLKSGFDLNSRGDRSRTVLMTAALEKDWPLVQELLKAGAEANCPDESGATPLMVAAMSQDAAPSQALLAAGADANAKDANGHGPLHYAVASQSQPALVALLKAGASASGNCCPDHDLVTHALETKKKEIVAPIVEAQSAGVAWGAEAREMLAAAIAAKDVDFTKLMLARFTGAPTAEGKAQPLLAYAVLENDMPRFKYLLECGADPNTPLQSPVEKAFSEKVTNSFLRSYLDNEGGMTTLMLAAGLERLDFVKALLEAGAKRNLATTKYKMPAVVFAARTENPEVMQTLLGDCPTPDQMRIEISLSSQRASLYKNGASVFSTPISSGRTGFATPTGRFVVTDKHANHRSTLYPADMPYFMRLSYRDFGMHQGALPGYPASHGCIRLPNEAARQLYKDVPIGTLVSITR